MEERFRHYLLTRFNVSLHWPENAHVPPGILDQRFELFESLCFPSVANQNIGNFTWLVFFDEDTPSVYRQKISVLEKQFPPFRPVYLKRHAPGTKRHFLVSARYRDIIRSLGGLDRSHLITTRLDNDDAVTETFITDIQGSFRPVEKMFVNFTDGYILDCKTGELNFSRADDGTNTLSYIESCENPDNVLTVYYYDHHRNAAEFAPVTNCTSKPAWLISVHDSNIMNTSTIHPVTGRANESERDDCEGAFGIRLPVGH